MKDSLNSKNTRRNTNIAMFLGVMILLAGGLANNALHTAKGNYLKKK
jgi:hypothetical protein